MTEVHRPSLELFGCFARVIAEPDECFAKTMCVADQIFLNLGWFERMTGKNPELRIQRIQENVQFVEGLDV